MVEKVNSDNVIKTLQNLRAYFAKGLGTKTDYAFNFTEAYHVVSDLTDKALYSAARSEAKAELVAEAEDQKAKRALAKKKRVAKAKPKKVVRTVKVKTIKERKPVATVASQPKSNGSDHSGVWQTDMLTMPRHKNVEIKTPTGIVAKARATSKTMLNRKGFLRCSRVGGKGTLSAQAWRELSE